MAKESRWKSWFDVFDRDGDGQIMESDFSALADAVPDILGEPEDGDLRGMLREIYSAFFPQLLEKADKNGDGKVSREEWVNWISSFTEGKSTFDELDEFSQQMFTGSFNLADINMDGDIDAGEYSLWARAFLPWASEEAVSANFKKLIGGDEGVITGDAVNGLFQGMLFGGEGVPDIFLAKVENKA